jgi:DNA-binding CsgD family transcriptional regulator
MRERPAIAISSHPLAVDAFRRGDFHEVLHLVGAETPSVDLLLLRARALLKLQQAQDVVSELVPAIELLADTDARCTARMLLAAAIARTHLSHGRKLLAEVAGDAEQWQSHRSVQAEIAYFQAVTAWSARDFADAERFALVTEGAKLDVLSVRATQLRGFIAVSLAKYQHALILFQRARRAYANCREVDVDLATIILEQIAFLEQTLRSSRIRGTHCDPMGRCIPGASFGPALPTITRFRLCYSDAWLFANDGDPLSALRKIGEAVHLAASDAWHVWALAGQAAIAQAFGENATAQIVFEGAWQLAESVQWNVTKDEERYGLLQLAEVAAHLNQPVGREVLARYDSVVNPMDNTRTLRDRSADPRLVGWETYVRGLVERTLGNDASAVRHFREAISLFNSCGYRWREALALIELDATAGSSLASGPSPLEQAACIIGEHFPHSFLAQRLEGWAMAYVDPVVSRLTPTQRDVLRHLLEGRPAREIADVTGRTYQTILTHIKALHEALGTHCVQQIITECIRRRIAPPATRAESRIATTLAPARHSIAS